MHTGQMLMAIGAMVLLSVLILQVNNSVFNSENILDQSKYGVLAVSLATSVIEEAKSKSFDLATDNNSINDLSALTAPSSLGPKSSETYPDFNDFDDFNNYTRVDSSLPSAVFKLNCEVNYVNPSNPESVSSIKTWHKKLTVEVTSVSMQDTVEMSSIFSYWYFR
jgi:MSHA pilin protein MshD